eukprot:7382802-Pyramimonas_sp.AAC.2
MIYNFKVTGPYESADTAASTRAPRNVNPPNKWSCPPLASQVAAVAEALPSYINDYLPPDYYRWPYRMQPEELREIEADINRQKISMRNECDPEVTAFVASVTTTQPGGAEPVGVPDTKREGSKLANPAGAAGCSANE